MRFEAGEFAARIPGPSDDWTDFLISSSALDSALAAENKAGPAMLADSISSIGMANWVDAERSLAQNMAYGVQITGGVVSAFEDAASVGWNLDGNGVASSIFSGIQSGLEGAIGPDGTIDPDKFASQLAKAGLGIALAAVSAAVPVAGAVAAIVVAGVSFAVKEYRDSQGADFYPMPGTIDLSPGESALCTSGAASAADEYMIRMLRDSVVFTSKGTSSGIPSTTGQLSSAAKKTNLTRLFMPGPIPTGATSPELLWTSSHPDHPINDSAGSRHPMAPTGKWTSSSWGYLSEIDHSGAPPGSLRVIRDRCEDRPDQVFVRIGIAGGLGSGSDGYGWMPGMGHFSGDHYVIGQRGKQRGENAGGPGETEGGQDLAFPHSIWGLEPNVRQADYITSASLYPASSSMMASMERQAMSAPGCFLVQTTIIRARWAAWMDGMRALAERLAWEGNALPGSIERSYWDDKGPGTFLPQSMGGGGDSIFLANRYRPYRYNQSSFFLGDADVMQIAHWYTGQATAWRVLRGGVEIVTSDPDKNRPIPSLMAGSSGWWSSGPHGAGNEGGSGLQWLDGDPFDDFRLSGSHVLLGYPQNFIPDRIYRFRDLTGRIADKGTIGEFGPVDQVAINPWCDSVREMQMWALKTLQCAYITSESPCFEVPNDATFTLRNELRNRREQLLTHEARFSVETRDILDSVGPDSYLALLKSSGVGKMGAGSFDFAPGGAELDPGHPAAPKPQLAAPEPSGGGAWKKQAKGLGFAAPYVPGPSNNSAAIAAAGALAAWLMLRR